jgi:hypothetical protein
VSVMEEFGNNDIGCTSLNVIIPATSYMTCIPTGVAKYILAGQHISAGYRMGFGLRT